jgi:hypothetical protein
MLPPVDAASGPAEGARRANDRRHADFGNDGAGLFDAVRVAAARQVETDALDGGFEQVPVLRLLDRLDFGADELDAVAIQDARLCQFQGRVQPGLSADGGQQRIRPFRFDDFFQHFDRDRLDVRAVGEIRVGHDRRRV